MIEYQRKGLFDLRWVFCDYLMLVLFTLYVTTSLFLPGWSKLVVVPEQVQTAWDTVR